MSIKYVLCQMEFYFDKEQDQSMCRVLTPLQLFNTPQEAEVAYDVFSPFYDYKLRIVRSDQMDETFR